MQPSKVQSAVPAAPLAQRRPRRSAVRHGQASCADYGCTRTECRQAARRARRQRHQNRLRGIPARVPPYAAARWAIRLREQGMSAQDIADRAGLAVTLVAGCSAPQSRARRRGPSLSTTRRWVRRPLSRADSGEAVAGPPEAGQRGSNIATSHIGAARLAQPSCRRSTSASGRSSSTAIPMRHSRVRRLALPAGAVCPARPA